MGQQTAPIQPLACDSQGVPKISSNELLSGTGVQLIQMMPDLHALVAASNKLTPNRSGDSGANREGKIQKAEVFAKVLDAICQDSNQRNDVIAWCQTLYNHSLQEGTTDHLIKSVEPKTFAQMCQQPSNRTSFSAMLSDAPPSHIKAVAEDLASIATGQKKQCLQAIQSYLNHVANKNKITESTHAKLKACKQLLGALKSCSTDSDVMNAVKKVLNENSKFKSSGAYARTKFRGLKSKLLSIVNPKVTLKTKARIPSMAQQFNQSEPSKGPSNTR